MQLAGSIVTGVGFLVGFGGALLLQRYRNVGLHLIATGGMIALMGAVIAFAVKL